MASWGIDSITITGGFLADVTLQLPTGLICIIGPRGSGKSTLAEALRLALAGVSSTASKPRQDLIKANLGSSMLTLVTKPNADRGGFTIRRSYGQPPVVTASDGRPVTTIDLDRGTFLPLDAYTSIEIEAIAEESLGGRRRQLLDDLCASEMQQVHLGLSDQKRRLEANAEAIHSTIQRLHDLTEHLEEVGDARARLASLPSGGRRDGSPAFQKAAKQKRTNDAEASALASVGLELSRLSTDIAARVEEARSRIPESLAVQESANESLLRGAERSIATLWTSLDQAVATARLALRNTSDVLDDTTKALREAHLSQEAIFLSLQHDNQEAVRIFEERTVAEKEIAAITALENELRQASEKLATLHEERKSLKADYVLLRDTVSDLRESVAQRLQNQAGARVRLRVQRNADVLEYQQELLAALHGSKLKNQDDILRTLSALRPEDLAVMIREDDVAEFDTQTSFGRERGRKILDALRTNLDPLELDVLAIDDRIMIELDVATGGNHNFKDASELSRGQRCTALLPILLARRDTPLLIDQPEDNLDNHFIYRTVVESILRLKANRQMIFITHNANIPVLGEAELVIVMNSDGRRGFIDKLGTVDDCRDEIIDLLEGGQEAFDLRRQRYGS